jgi:hypothetical protein
MDAQKKGSIRDFFFAQRTSVVAIKELPNV